MVCARSGAAMWEIDRARGRERESGEGGEGGGEGRGIICWAKGRGGEGREECEGWRYTVYGICVVVGSSRQPSLVNHLTTF